MGVANEIVDAVTAKLGETTFGSAVVRRELVPDITKKGQAIEIVVSLGAKQSAELSRTNEQLTYRVVVALYHPSPSGEADHKLALDMLEDIQDWLSRTDNRELSLATQGEACLVLPFEIDTSVDAAIARELGCYFALTTFNYRYSKGRTP